MIKIQLEDMDAEVLKGFLIDGEHNGWDGWDEPELTVVKAFIEDLKMGVALNMG